MRTVTQILWRVVSLVRMSPRIAVTVGLVSLGFISCSYAPRQRGGIDMYAGWPLAREAFGSGGLKRSGPTRQVAHAPRQGPMAPLKVALPAVPNAEVIGDDEICSTCHERFMKQFHEKNVHRNQKCEDCHGPGSEHVTTRGQEPGKILSFKRLAPAERSELCLKCHEKDKVEHVAQWRTSVHAHKGVTCNDCHTGHYEVPPGTPVTELAQAPVQRPHWNVVNDPAREKKDPVVRPTASTTTRLQSPEPVGNASSGEPSGTKPSLRGTSHSLGATNPSVCFRCHGTQRLNELMGPHRVGGGSTFTCTTCHDAQGTLTPQTGKEACQKCHSDPSAGAWHSSTHNAAGLYCIDCHNPHPQVSPEVILQVQKGASAGVPRPMSVIEPQACVRCHQEAGQLAELADPHQVGTPGRFVCSTCHDPHGQIRQNTRKDLCLTCHNGTPTAAWHSSTHNLKGVMCTDCHEPHPNSHVQPIVDIRHPNVRRPKRRPMAVNDPDVCYKCHPKMYGQSVMPSHHPIWEGKMVCSDCHDAHGQALKLLKEPTVNLVCYRCHSELQGPFVYEHPPVTQDCTICHEPHGTVHNNLLIQPTTFLCLRCHSGHRTGPQFHDAKLLPDIGTHPDLQKAFFADCTECHSQIHGSDVPSPNQPGVFVR